MRHDGGNERVRGSALWGSGTRAGETRSSALWGKGGRRLVLALAAMLTLAFPFVAMASSTGSTAAKGDPGPQKVKPAPPTYISPDLAKKADTKPTEMVQVIVQSTDGTDAAARALEKVMGKESPGLKNLDLVGGAAVQIRAAKLNDLLTITGLTITPDSPVRLSGANDPYDSKQLWANETGNKFGWGTKDKPAPAAPTIAFVDSGIDANRADFDNGARVVAQVNMTTLTGNSAGDGRGHGTFVAGIAAGSAPHLAGASPKSNIVMIDVMDDQGMARTSDVIAAAQWILANKATYNIKVANFSLHSTTPSNFTRDPLDKAVESLWFGGVTVVVAAGNYGTATGPSGVLYAPANDPFVITVGALDLGKGPATGDDITAPWSAYGSTYDGFMKPEISAPGRYMVGPVPSGSTLVTERPTNVVNPGAGVLGTYMQLSGTSFAAAVVAGTAAQILAAHASWTPGQVKGVLMLTARRINDKSPKYSAGAGVITAAKAINYDQNKTPANPNVSLDAFVKSDGNGGYVFDGAKWTTVASANPAWDSGAYSDMSWHNMSWQDISWTDISWSSMSWHNVSWNDMATSAVADGSSREDAVESDANTTGGVYIDDAGLADVLCDPYLNPFPPITCQSSTAPPVTPVATP